MKSGVSKLQRGDEVTLFHNGSGLGRFKVIEVRSDGSYRAELQLPSGTWQSGHSFSNDGLFSWINLTRPSHPNGCVCKKCNSGNPFAEPNQADGTYICFECR